MKCKVCGGTGTSNTCVNGTFKPCTFCDGTGEYEPFDADVELDKLYPTEQTNEEWLHTLNTEQKAEFLFKMACHCSTCGDESQDTWKKVMSCPFGKTACVKNDWESWLKQPYTSKE